jgi:hypothetical protein
MLAAEIARVAAPDGHVHRPYDSEKTISKLKQ